MHKSPEPIKLSCVVKCVCAQHVDEGGRTEAAQMVVKYCDLKVDNFKKNKAFEMKMAIRSLSVRLAIGGYGSLLVVVTLLLANPHRREPCRGRRAGSHPGDAPASGAWLCSWLF